MNEQPRHYHTWEWDLFLYSTKGLWHHCRVLIRGYTKLLCRSLPGGQGLLLWSFWLEVSACPASYCSCVMHRTSNVTGTEQDPKWATSTHYWIHECGLQLAEHRLLLCTKRSQICYKGKCKQNVISCNGAPVTADRSWPQLSFERHKNGHRVCEHNMVCVSSSVLALQNYSIPLRGCLQHSSQYHIHSCHRLVLGYARV